MVVELNADNFENEVLNSDKPVLIDFFAQWCGPCKMSAPFVEEFAENNKGIKVCKLDVEAAPSMAVKYGVMNVPTFVYIDKGEVKNKKVGAVNTDALNELVNL